MTNPIVVRCRVVLLTFALTVACVSSIQAAEPAPFKRFLIPTFVQQPIPGAHGSRWASEAWFLYSGDDEALLAPTPFCFSFECLLTEPVPPGYPPLQFSPAIPLQEPAVFAHVDAAHAAAFTFELRIRDLSREADSAGTEIPVVPEEEMFSGPLRLLNVPVRVKFRNSLRIYALPEIADPEVEVRYFRMQPFGQSPKPVPTEVVLLRVDRVQLRRRPPTEVETRLGINGIYPAIAEVANFQSLPEIRNEARGVWIEVVPITPNLRIWAFTSITNDDTQQVTIVTP
jgi:hypothetical protein